MQNCTKSLKNRKAAIPELQCEGSWYFVCFVSWFNGREAGKLLGLNNGKWVQFGNWCLQTLNTVSCKRTSCAHPCRFAERDTVYCCIIFLVRRTIIFYRGKGGGGTHKKLGWRCFTEAFKTWPWLRPKSLISLPYLRQGFFGKTCWYHKCRPLINLIINIQTLLEVFCPKRHPVQGPK